MPQQSLKHGVTRFNSELCEGIGVMVLLGGILATSLSDNEASLLAGGIVLMLIYSIGTVSGAHINPMVSLAFMLSGRLPRSQCLRYLVAQGLGAIAITILFYALALPLNPPQVWVAGFGLEAFLTGCLLTVILRLATTDCRLCPDTRPVVGVVVGITVAVLARWGGVWEVGLMNPLLAIPASLIHSDLSVLVWTLAADSVGVWLALAFSTLTTPTP